MAGATTARVCFNLEMDRQDIQVNGKLNHKAALLAKAFSVQELEAMRKRMIAAAEAHESKKSQTLVDAPAQLAESKQPGDASPGELLVKNCCEARPRGSNEHAGAIAADAAPTKNRRCPCRP